MKLSCQLDPIHWGPQHERLLAAWQPKSIRIINPDAGRIQRIMAVCPNSLYVLRDHGPSEDHAGLSRDPVGLGKEHAQMWGDKLARWGLGLNPEQFVFLGINEPHVWEPGVPEKLNEYTVAFLEGLRAAGLRGGAMSFSVGWPANTGHATPVDWSPYQRVLDYLRRNPQHFLCLHEYWCKDGPQPTADLSVDWDGGPWGWLAGRYRQCPANVPIIIGECGLEQAVCETVEYWQRGWRAYYSDRPGVYTSQLLTYESAILEDPRIHSAQIYLLDGNTHHWGSLYYEPQIPHFGRNKDHSWYVKLGTPPTKPPDPQPPADFASAIRAAGRAAQVISLNPDAALQKAMIRDGFTVGPVGNENTAIVDGVTYIVQRAETGTGPGVTYYVKLGDWSNVRKISD